MMSSVIPARLVFQCGHAALVSLPRIKGESFSQRADRVAREKSAAHLRACDFCAQRLEVVVQQAVPASPPALPDAPAVAPPVAPAEPVPLRTRRPAHRRNGVAAVTRPPAAAPVDEVVTASPPAAKQPGESPATKNPPTRAAAKPAPAQPVAQPMIAPAAAKPAPRKASPVRVTRGRPPGVVTRVAQNIHVAAGQRFVVQLQLQTVLRATDMHDALRQAQSLGAVEVLAITRQD